jgi:CBS-domain-containing membrane protein
VFGAIESPLAQPRSLIFGHFFSALIGVCVTKLFSLMPDQARFESLRWLAASLSTAIAIVVMQLTGTTHPPAGATALLPATNDEVWNLSWYYLPVVLLSSTMLMCCALLLNNNMHRRYPVFWFTPPAPPKPAPTPGPVPSAPLMVEPASSEEKLPKDPV